MYKVDEELIKVIAEMIAKFYKNDNKGEILIDGVEFYEDKGDWKRISFIYKIKEVEPENNFDKICRELTEFHEKLLKKYFPIELQYLEDFTDRMMRDREKRKQFDEKISKDFTEKVMAKINKKVKHEKKT